MRRGIWFSLGAIAGTLAPLAGAPLAIWLHERNLKRNR